MTSTPQMWQGQSLAFCNIFFYQLENRRGMIINFKPYPPLKCRARNSESEISNWRVRKLIIIGNFVTVG